MQGYFVSGTDTGVGKTWITLGLMGALKNRFFTVAGMKPVASGCELTSAGLRNEDARLIQVQCSAMPRYEQVNPYAFEPGIAPHVAAAMAGIHIDLERIADCYRELARSVNTVVVEGVGGWRVPLNETQTLRDLVALLQLPVILVVGIRLGCINHALLTAETIRRDGLKLAAWVANQVEADYSMPGATLDYLRRHIEAPLMGVVPCMTVLQPERIAACLRIEVLHGESLQNRGK